MGTVASQITRLTIVYSTVYLGADQRKHQSSASQAFVRGIHRGPVNSPHKRPVTRKKLWTPFSFCSSAMPIFVTVVHRAWIRGDASDEAPLLAPEKRCHDANGKCTHDLINNSPYILNKGTKIRPRAYVLGRVVCITRFGLTIFGILYEIQLQCCSFSVIDKGQWVVPDYFDWFNPIPT